MKKVEFTATRTVEDADGKVILTFEKGKRYDLEDASADRWIRREVAFDVKDKPKPPEPTTGETVDKPADKAKGK